MEYRGWIKRFADAFRGVRMGVLGEQSFAVHVPMAVLVVACAWYFQVTTAEWLVLVLCITLVMSLELMNSGLERIAKAVTKERNVFVGAALDISAGAVLIGAIGAAICGLVIFWPRIAELVSQSSN